MTPEEKELLNKTYKLVEENNGILKSMRLSNRVSTVFRFAYWFIIIALSFGAYYFIQPYMNFLTETINSVSGQGGGSILNNNTNPLNNLQDLLK
jgi:hypothetical protein